MLASSFIRSSLLTLSILAGCFAEVGSIGGEDDGGDTTSAQMCAAGGLGCECYGNGTCDAGFECVGALDVCVPMDCTAGSLQCICDAGGCDGALACIDGVCVTMAPGTTTVDPSGDPSGEVSSGGEADTTEGGDSSSASSASVTTDDPDSSSGSDEVGTEGETNVVECGDLPCGECVECVGTPGGECDAAATACSGEAGCEAAAACLESCGVKGLCLDDCCEVASPAAASAAMAFNGCRHDVCTAACGGDYNLGQCTP